MRSVRSTFNKHLRLFSFLMVASVAASAQDNSPFSRYGLGDIFPGQHVINRGMGGASVAYRDALGQSVNFYNPATYSGMALVSYDIGIGIDNRQLTSAEPFNKYRSTNFTPSYIMLAMPLNKKRGMGLAFGLRPISKISYSIRQDKRVPGIDSLTNLYQGDGGLYEAFFGLGKRWGGLSVGFNGGYTFGRKQTDTRTIFANDTVGYTSSNYRTSTSFSKFGFTGGVQYQFKPSKRTQVRLGLTGRAQRELNASEDVTRETFFYDVNGNSIPVDTAFSKTGREGTVVLPGTYTAGIAFETLTKDNFSRFLVTAEYENTKWSKYRIFGQPDRLVDNAYLRFGLQLSPDYLKAQSFWGRATYRTGFYVGKDYINADGNELKEFGITLGAGFPVIRRTNYTNQYSNIHTALEFGKRGSQVNNITQSFVRISVGLSLSDVWFIKRRYD